MSALDRFKRYAPDARLWGVHSYKDPNNGTTWQAWIDGVSQLTRSSQPATYSKAPLLGKNRAGWFFNGNIAEVLVRRTISTTQEVADLKTYFNSEHGLTVT